MDTNSKPRLIVVSLRLPFVAKRRDDGTIGRTESRDEMMRTVSHVVLKSKGSKWIGHPGLSLRKVSIFIKELACFLPSITNYKPRLQLTHALVSFILIGSTDTQR